jgi:hypothetical protein
MAGNKLNLASKPATSAGRSERRKILGALLVRREGWRLTWGGRLLVLLLLVTAMDIGIRKLDFFLSVNHPLRSETLIVEGWIPPAPLFAAANMIKSGHYRMVITSGCLASDEWGISTNDTYAEFAATRLAKAGVAPALIQPIPSRVERKDRTYHSALAVKKWLDEHNIFPGSIDVVTLGPHARRSRLLYEKVFGDNVKIGIIPLDDPKYDAARWWISSEGVREVMGEAIAYLYARFLFRVSDQT